MMNKRQETLDEIYKLIENHAYDIPVYWESYMASQIFKAVYEDRQHWIQMLENMIEADGVNNG